MTVGAVNVDEESKLRKDLGMPKKFSPMMSVSWNLRQLLIPSALLGHCPFTVRVRGRTLFYLISICDFHAVKIYPQMSGASGVDWQFSKLLFNCIQFVRKRVRCTYWAFYCCCTVEAPL